MSDLLGRRPFRDRAYEHSSHPRLNPYVELHREFGPQVIPGEEAPQWRGRWAELSGREAPLHVEIGSGNGFFLSGMAARHPEQDWIGIELRFKRVVLCARKLQQVGATNARIVRYDAFNLDDLFTPASISGLYVNHPDPWAKESQAGRRLLGRPFVAWAAGVLVPGASFRLKTDHAPNVELLLESIQGLPYEVLGQTDDIRRDGSPWGEDDVITNYQRKFYQRGLPVLGLWVRRRES